MKCSEIVFTSGSNTTNNRQLFWPSCLTDPHGQNHVA